MAPTTTKQWTVQGQNGFDSLQFNEKAEIPKLGENEVLVHFYAASLNYRDLIIPKVCKAISLIWKYLTLTKQGQISVPNQRRRRSRFRWRWRSRSRWLGGHSLHDW